MQWIPQAHHVIQIHALGTLLLLARRLMTRETVSRKLPTTDRRYKLEVQERLEVRLCVHSVCRCGKQRPEEEVRQGLAEIVHKKYNIDL